MKSIIRTLIALTILCLGTSACGKTGQAGFFLGKPSATPTASATATATLTPTATATPTPTATPTITPTPTPAFVTVEKGPVTVPILLYHHITADLDGSRYNVDPAIFDEQMKWLSDNHYTTITVSQVAELILNGGQMPLRPVVITFDDGNFDIYQNSYPILQKYGFVATFYIVDRYINGKDMITTDEVKELIQAGWEIGSHSKYHTDLLSAGADLETEVRMSKLDMEERLGVPINSFAYPFGSANPDVIGKVIRSGYTSAVGLGEAITHGYYDVFYLNRIEIQADYDMQKFISLMPWSGELQ
jgi:peptidoglycan/xylan/chitin deacetylase (PgdA/CDA1 family)